MPNSRRLNKIAKRVHGRVYATEIETNPVNLSGDNIVVDLILLLAFSSRHKAAELAARIGSGSYNVSLLHRATNR